MVHVCRNYWAKNQSCVKTNRWNWLNSRLMIVKLSGVSEVQNWSGTIGHDIYAPGTTNHTFNRLISYKAVILLEEDKYHISWITQLWYWGYQHWDLYKYCQDYPDNTLSKMLLISTERYVVSEAPKDLPNSWASSICSQSLWALL